MLTVPVPGVFVHEHDQTAAQQTQTLATSVPAALWIRGGRREINLKCHRTEVEETTAVEVVVWDPELLPSQIPSGLLRFGPCGVTRAPVGNGVGHWRGQA